jgi:RNA polymerase-binding transcription factor DksA
MATSSLSDAAVRSAPVLTDVEIEALRAELSAARDEYAERLRITLETGSDADAHETSNGTFDREFERLAARVSRDIVNDVDAALARMGEERYGVCEGCESPIPFERLQAVPHTSHCIDCA